ncbi:hypothetical protein BH18ACT4_BH18ACT4_16280 [soil metagenome]
MFDLKVVSLDHSAAVFVAGDLDLATAPVLASVLEVQGSRTSQVVVDLSDTAFVDFSGMRVLETAAAQLEAAGVTLSLRGMKPGVVRTMRLFEMLESVTLE